MAQVEIRQRAGFLFLALMVGHVILISAQVQSRSGVPVLEAVTFGFFAEVQRGSSALVGGIRSMWSGYIGLRHVKAENETLKRQLAEVQIELQQQRAVAGRAKGLEELLGMRQGTPLKTAAATVIAAGATPEFRTVTIDKGTRDGLSKDMAVVAASGVVGRVVIASGLASKVQLLIDRNAAAGALIERSRAQGVVVGAGDDLLRMDYVSEVTEVAVGDLVVTSGIDGIFPKGFTIGRVEKVEKSGGGYRQILIRPAVEHSSLEEVLVVLTPPPADIAGEEPSQ
jgi:rod shape-determining protein MreC